MAAHSRHQHRPTLVLRTRAALGVIAFGRIDRDQVRFNWSSSAKTPPETANNYGQRADDLPIAVRLDRGDSPLGEFYGNLLEPRVAYLTEVEFLTQGQKVPNKIGTHPLADGAHELVLTAQSLDGSETTQQFTLNVPPWPGRITIHRRQEGFHWTLRASGVMRRLVAGRPETPRSSLGGAKRLPRSSRNFAVRSNSTSRQGARTRT